MPTIDMVKTGQNIKNMRIACGMTVKDMQDKMAFGSATTIYKWQNGQAMPTIDNFICLAFIFGTTIDQIVVTC